jgi:hypothetical protein
LVIRQIAALAIAVDNSNQLVKAYRRLRDISDRSVKLSENEQAHLEQVYWPREEQFLAEFSAPEEIEEIEVLGRRYAGRLVSSISAGFATQIRALRCGASRYNTSAYSKSLQDIIQARTVALASARVLGRNIGFAEVQARTDTNYNRRMQAVAMGKSLLAEAQTLLGTAGRGLAAAVGDASEGFNSAIEAFGAARQDWKSYRNGTLLNGPPNEDVSAPRFRPTAGQNTGVNPMDVKGAMNNFSSAGTADVAVDLSVGTGIHPNVYANSQPTIHFNQQSERINGGMIVDHDLVRAGTVEFPVKGVTGGTCTVSMDAFGLKFVGDKSPMPATGGGMGMVIKPY